jgi:hypothetical protein
MSRGLGVVGAGVALAALLGGCDWTAMSASELRQPVLFGPVPCIGCAPLAPESTAAPASRISARRHTEVLVEYFSFVGPLGVAPESHPIGVSLDRVMYWTPCNDDVRLSNVRARAWQMTVPLLFFQSDVSVAADATPVPVPGARCAPLR